MNDVFQEFLHCFVNVYIDNIPICSRNVAENRHHMSQGLQKLYEYYLYLKLEKCEFHPDTIYFLGYVINEHGIQLDQRKVQAVKEWPQLELHDYG